MIPGWLISIVTFPGVILHEFSHKFFCDKAGVKVLEVCYFRFGNPAGFVVHESAKKFRESFLITVGPFIIGTIMAVISFAFYKIFHGSSFDLVFTWLGISIGANSLPSSGDAKGLWIETKRHIKDEPLAFIGFPIALIIWIASLLSFFWIDFIYAFSLYLLVDSFI